MVGERSECAQECLSYFSYKNIFTAQNFNFLLFLEYVNVFSIIVFSKPMFLIIKKNKFGTNKRKLKERKNFDLF